MLPRKYPYNNKDFSSRYIKPYQDQSQIAEVAEGVRQWHNEAYEIGGLDNKIVQRCLI